MNIVPEIKACEACAKSKRKCGKEKPRCHRCESRDVDCIYPPARPSSFVLLQDDPMTPASSNTSAALDRFADIWDPNILLCPLPEFDLPLSACNVDLHLSRPSPTPPKHLTCEWFMAPETWESFVLQKYARDPQWRPPYSNAVLKRFLEGLQRRLYKWVSTGGTDFIHRRLYTFRNPRCVQDAQTTLALYLARTDSNEGAVFSTLHDRARQLLEDEDRHATSNSLDLFEHLARVHALITYQIVGLLDGDIHLRTAAEGRMELLNTWLEQMFECVRVVSSFCPGGIDDSVSVISNAIGLGIELGQAQESQVMREEVVWHAWILAESIRRTWITVQGLHTTYHALQKGWADCSGSIKLTAGQGMWGAPSSYAWAKVARETDIWFIEGTDMERLFIEATADKVDEFTKGIMEMTFGMERMERWGHTVVV